ncbi:aminotransferase class III-fold pyridoxal phosphate-dependent enzyme [uncultured Albimonas sp.]|uniref:aspartate aminotransferase family protein n=1 Tax=uncultured Albimonas sp. TaxID=1331701 RepID=UPI0030EC1B77
MSKPSLPPRNSSAASAALFERALKVMPGGSTRSTLFFAPHPPYARSGAGTGVVDEDGLAYVDFANNFFSQIHGNAHPEIVAAIAGAAASGVSFGLPTRWEVELAELLVARVPAFEQVRFANSGSEAVMTALKAARAYSGRPGLAKIEGAYHGSYDHAEVSLDPKPESWGEASDPARISYVAGAPQAVLDDTVVIPFNDAEAARRILAANAHRLAAVLFDPLPPRAGMVPASVEFVAALVETARAHGVLVVMDEVVSFRLSHGGAHPLWGIDPDLTALGKMIGGGLPVGAVAGRAEVMKVFDGRSGKAPLPHGGTFTANPLTMAAGLAALRLADAPAIERINALGERLRARVHAGARAAGLAIQVAGMGSLFRVHLTDRRIDGYRAAWLPPEEAARLAAVHRRLLAAGFLVTPNISGAISTPTTQAEVDALALALVEAVAAEAG